MSTAHTILLTFALTVAVKNELAELTERASEFTGALAVKLQPPLRGFLPHQPYKYPPPQDQHPTVEEEGPYQYSGDEQCSCHWQFSISWTTIHQFRCEKTQSTPPCAANGGVLHHPQPRPPPPSIAKMTTLYVLGCGTLGTAILLGVKRAPSPTHALPPRFPPTRQSQSMSGTTSKPSPSPPSSSAASRTWWIVDSRTVSEGAPIFCIAVKIQ